MSALRHERHLSEHTLANYERDLLALRAAAGGKPLAGLQQHQIRSFAARMHAQGLSGASIARRLSAWRSFYRWLTRRTPGAQAAQLPASNPADGVRAPKRAKRLPKALSVEHAVALAETVPEGGMGARDHAICELFYSSGLRLTELVRLDCRYTKSGAGETAHESSSWLDLGSAEVTVKGKGGKTRSVPVGSRALEALRAWLAARGEFERPGGEPALFLSAKGARISPRTVQERIKALARAAGIPVDVHPHVLRHSFATHVLQSSGDLRAVQDMLGHASIAATQVYTTLDFQHLSKVYDAAHPRARRKT
ncbi:MAG: tyrosine recombinase XerC [Candidatus Protistobacter heckmanni]|nr:tyrosine recombinase XerC [Candidatus Protistobacter heckmanni]